jgi:hypothetical protein
MVLKSGLESHRGTWYPPRKSNHTDMREPSLGLDVGPDGDRCCVNLNNDRGWVMRTQMHVAIQLRVSSPSFKSSFPCWLELDMSWISIRIPCRAEWTHRIGELTEIIISSHHCCYFSGILYRLDLRETVMDVSRVAVHYDLPPWSCVQWRYCT